MSQIFEKEDRVSERGGDSNFQCVPGGRGGKGAKVREKSAHREKCKKTREGKVSEKGHTQVLCVPSFLSNSVSNSRGYGQCQRVRDKKYYTKRAIRRGRREAKKTEDAQVDVAYLAARVAVRMELVGRLWTHLEKTRLPSWGKKGKINGFGGEARRALQKKEVWKKHLA